MLLTWTVTIIAVLLSIFVHYEAFLRLAQLMKHMHVFPRFRIAIGAVGALIAHGIEIAIFGVAYMLLSSTGRHGHLAGDFSGSLFDYHYYSYSAYTSLGIGDILPIGHLRLLTGIEALTGLVLIAWTASFMYMQMQKLWREV